MAATQRSPSTWPSGGSSSTCPEVRQHRPSAWQGLPDSCRTAGGHLGVWPQLPPNVSQPRIHSASGELLRTAEVKRAIVKGA